MRLSAGNFRFNLVHQALTLCGGGKMDLGIWLAFVVASAVFSLSPGAGAVAAALSCLSVGFKVRLTSSDKDATSNLAIRGARRLLTKYCLLSPRTMPH